MIAKKTTAPPKAKTAPPKGGQVLLCNHFAGRPLMFRIPGKSIRLGPGESTTVSKDCLSSNELRGLCASGLIVVEKPAAKKHGRTTRSVSTSKPASQARKAAPARAKTRPTASVPKKRRGRASKADSSGKSGADR